jgi:uncharacterized protein YndB with AHSA1/START domain
MADPEQVILESDPYRRLAYTWHTFTPELAEVAGFDDEFFARIVQEPRSKVTFDIEETDDGVKLTVVHDGLQPGGAVLESISGGWTLVLSRLKSVLEVEDARKLPPSKPGRANVTCYGTRYSRWGPSRRAS